jgi:hypothetical protein
MKNHKKILLPILLIIVALSICLPVRAESTTYYYDYTPDETYGDWHPLYNRAIEFNYSNIYKCELVFVYTSVSQNADEYWINLDYNGETPGYWPYTESLKMEYRWSDNETWTCLCYLDLVAFDGEIVITDATSSTLYLRFKDCGRTSDGVATTWYFGYEPYLAAYFE